jgi:hypothetical protein
MWQQISQQYRRTLIPVQVVILTVALVMYFGVHMPVESILVGIVLPMEIFAVIGAAWAVRLKGKIERASGRSLR